nr:malonyl-coenzyme:anthocyanin 5-O-glucoside-6'''-O-malonyltransferase [Solanum lycopersicum]
MATVIEQCQVAPPPGGATEVILPLTYFDHVWLGFRRMRRILFYKLSISKPDFVQNIIPPLKNSLSLTLKHYTPLVGNIACPLNSSGYPELCYVTGDSVSDTFTETDMDFNHLIGNHPRNANDFYPFIPQLAQPKDAPGFKLVPVLAIQVTLFPNLGISIGFSNHHVACDGNIIVKFIRTWGLLNKLRGDEQCLANELIPFYDRSVIKDPYKQGTIIWDEMKQNMPEIGDIIVIPPLDRVRGTFIMERNNIVKLKNLILSRRPNLSYVTSFTITCAYIWTCLIKSKFAIEDEMIDEDVMEIFGCVADCRSRLNPPLPQSYFGNCLVTIASKASRVELVGKEGFITAVEVIGEAIKSQMKDVELILNCSWYREFCGINMKHTLSVSGSPKFNLYEVDFGWGRPEKIEIISIDNSSGISMSISKYKDSHGDLEVGLSLPKTRMNAFVAIFNHGLSFL